MKKATIVRLKQVTHIKNEITLLRKMDHPGLVKMCGMFQTDENLYLILEYINGGELFSHLRSAVRFPNHQVGEDVVVIHHYHCIVCAAPFGFCIM